MKLEIVTSASLIQLVQTAKHLFKMNQNLAIIKYDYRQVFFVLASDASYLAFLDFDSSRSDYSVHFVAPYGIMASRNHLMKPLNTVGFGGKVIGKLSPIKSLALLPQVEPLSWKVYPLESTNFFRKFAQV